jgi:HK97 family phage portal protein
VIFQTFGTLRRKQATRTVAPTWYAPSAWDIRSQTYAGDYATIYRTQPSVRVCVEFLHRNLAQMGLLVYRRESNDSRIRIRTGMAAVLRRPNAWTSRYRLIQNMIGDLCVYGSAYWFKMPRAEQGYALIRMHPQAVEAVGSIMPIGYNWTVDSRVIENIPPARLVHFRWYDPDSDLLGVSPLETLRKTLLEEKAAADYRNALWQNGARMPGYIHRPKDAGLWNDEQRKRFREQFNRLYTGPQNAGRIPILEDGMTFKEASFTSSDAQYVESRKLNIEEVARVYQLPLPMAGILDHATFSNVREQHKHLYQDCFGPILGMVEDDVDLQLLPDFHDPDTYYSEFNIAEKLKGSFEEQAAAIKGLTDRAIMTANEGRARINLPAVDDPTADQLVRPLNMTTEAPADKSATAPTSDELDYAPDDASAGAFDLRLAALEREILALRAIYPDLERSSVINGSHPICPTH